MHPRLTLISILLALGLGFALPTAQAQSAGPAVIISVANVTHSSGTVMGALYAGSWESEPVALAHAPPNAPTLTFRAPGPGRYAVRIFHDVDGDGRLDADLIGIPSEPYGTSNNAPARHGPPRYAEAAFDVGADGATQTIRLR